MTCLTVGGIVGVAMGIIVDSLGDGTSVDKELAVTSVLVFTISVEDDNELVVEGSGVGVGVGSGVLGGDGGGAGASPS